MTTVTFDQVVEKLNEAVQERGPDYVYVGPEGDRAVCLNWHEEQKEPGCIVGVVFHKLGFDWAHEMNYSSGYQLDTMTASSLLVHLKACGWQFDDYGKIDSLLSEIQAKQDRGVPWGEAVAEGREWARGEFS